MLKTTTPAKLFSFAYLSFFLLPLSFFSSERVDVVASPSIEEEIKVITVDYFSEEGVEELNVFPSVIAPPSVTDVYMTGGMKQLMTLTLNYTYVPNPNPEGATTFQWWYYDDQFGSNPQMIPGATTNVLQVRGDVYGLALAEFVGKHISCVVTPVDNMGTPGASVDFRPWGVAEANSVLGNIANCSSPSSFAQNFVPVADRCSPRDVTWTVSYTGINYSVGQQPLIYADWGDGIVESFTPTFVNPVPPLNFGDLTELADLVRISGQKWEITEPHTYDYDGASAPPVDGSCTYEPTAFFGIGVTQCNTADQTVSLFVWDEINNTDLGTHDIDHDNTSTGVEIAETVEVCAGDNSAIRLEDASTFNCVPTANGGNEDNNNNDESRWVQWVYGASSNITTGPAADEKIIINGVSYDPADLPVFGTPTQQAGPGVNNPNAITDDIQMPVSALVGEVFEVTIRSWNVCNQFSLLDDLNPPQGVGFDVFQINGPGVVGTEQAGLNAITGGVVFYANDAPVTRTFDIVMAPQPADPVAVDNIVCAGAVLPNFEITAAGNLVVEWYEDNAGAIDFGSPITNSMGANSLELDPDDFEPGGAIDTNTPGVYQVWARYSSNTGSQNCWSNPVQVTLEIVANPIPSPLYTIDGPNQCDFASLDLDASGTVDAPPGSTYLWEVDNNASFGSINFTFNAGTNQILNDQIVTHLGASTNRRNWNIRLTVTEPSGASCQTITEGADFFTYLTPTLTDPGDATICDGATTNLVLDHNSNADAQQRYNYTAVASGAVGDVTGFVTPVNNQTHPHTISQTLVNNTNIPQTVTYSVTVTNIQDGQNCQSAVEDIVVTIDPTSLGGTLAPAAPASICEGDNRPLLTLGGTVVGTIVRWEEQYNGGGYVDIGNGGSATLAAAPLAADGTYEYRVVVQSGVCPSVFSTISTIVVDQPSNAGAITPAGGITEICDGDNRPLLTLAGELGTIVRWEEDVDGGGFVDIGNGGSNTLASAALTPPGTYTYRAVIQNLSCAAVSNNEFVLEVHPVIASGNITIVDATICEGDTPGMVSGPVPTGGTGAYTYQWQDAPALGGPYTNIGGETGQNYTPAAPVTADVYYRRLVTSGPCSFTSNVIFIDVTPTLNPSTDISSDQVVCAAPPSIPAPLSGSDPTGGEGLGTYTYQWQSATISGGPYTDAVNGLAADGAPIDVTAATLTFAGTPLGPVRFFVRQETSGECTALSNEIRIDVSGAAPPMPTIDILTTNVCEGATGVTYTVSTPDPSDDPNGYEWTFDVLGTPVVSSNQTNTINYNFPAAGTIRIQVRASNGCGFSPISNLVDVVVDPFPNDNSLSPAADPVCSDTGGTNIVVASSQATVDYQLQIAPGFGNVGPALPGNGGNLNLPTGNLINTTGAAVVNTYRVVATNNFGVSCFIILTDNPTVTIDSEPVGFDDTDVTCSDVALSYDLQGNINGGGNSLLSDFSWVAADNPNVTGESLAPVGTATITDILNNVTNTDQVVVYTVTPTGQAGVGSCLGQDFTVTVTVRPEPRGFDDALATCSNVVLNYDLQANVDDTGNGGNNLLADFSWVAAPNASVSGESTVPVATAFITDDLENLTAVDQIVVYTVTPTGQAGVGSCTGNTFTVIVTVNPEPVGVADTETTCSNIALNYDLQNNVNSLGNGLASTFQWVAIDNANVTGESLAIQGTAFITDNLRNFTNTDQNVSYFAQATETGNSCIGDAFVITVTVQPEPVGFADTETTCSDVALAYDLQANVNDIGNGGNALASDFSWIAADNPNVTGESLVPVATAMITDNLNNVTNTDQVVVYTVTPTGQAGVGSCLGQDFTVTVTVQPEPVGFDDALTTCSDIALNYDLQANVDNIGSGGNNLLSDFSWVAASNPSVSGESTVPVATAFITDDLVNITSVDQIVIYTVTPTGQAGVGSCLGNVFTVTVTVQPEPAGAADTDMTCSNIALNYDLQNNVNSLGNALASNFVWVAADNVNVSGESLVNQNTAFITDNLRNFTNVDQVVVYTATPTDTGNSCLGEPFNITVTVQPEPVGFNDTEITCSDIALNYDLQANVNDIGNGGNALPATFSWVAADNPNVSGESLAPVGTLFITDDLVNLTLVDQVVQYTVTPTGQAGVGACLGQPFTVDVTVNPLPVANPIQAPDLSTPPTLTICRAPGVNQLFQIDDALNAGTTYQWTVPAGLTLVGSSTQQFVVIQAPIAIPSPGVPLELVETFTATGCVGPTNTIMIIVEDSPPAPVITGPTDVCDGENGVVFSIAAPVVGSTYNWNIGSLGVIVLGQGSSSITVDITGTTDNITVVENSAAGCVSPPAAPYTVTVNPLPNMTSANAINICSGTLISSVLSFTQDLGGGTFGWEVTSKSGFVGGTSVGNMGVGDINETPTNNFGVDGTVVYEVTPTSDPPGNCDGPSQFVTVTVHSEPVGLVDAETVCSDVALSYDIQVDNIDLLGNNLASTFTYTVVSSDPGNVPPEADRVVASPAGITQTYTNQTNVNVDITYTITPFETFSGLLCQGSDFDVVFTIQPEPLYTGVLDATVCSDDVSGIVLSNIDDDAGVITSYDVAAAVDPGLTGVPTTATGTTNLNLIASDVFNNVTNASHDVVYTVTPYFGACDGDVFTITLTVDPEPVYTGNLDATVCSDDVIGVVLPGIDDDAGVITSYDVAAVVDPNLTGVATTATGTANVNLIATDAFNNVTDADHDVVYTITPYFGTCAGADFNITVTINSEPLFTGNLDVTVCSDAVIGVVLPAIDDDGGAINSYDIAAVVDPDLTGAATIASGTVNVNLIFGDSFTNLENTSRDVVYTITPYRGTCQGADFTITATIDPEPLFTGNLDTNVCSDVAIGVVLPAVDDDTGGITSYDVAAVVDPDLTGVATTGIGTTDVNFISGDVFTNVTPIGQDVVYTITPYFGTCAGDDFNITVTIDPEPLYTGNLDVTVCSDAVGAIVLPSTDDDGGAITSYDVAAVVDPGLTGAATTATGTTNVNLIAADVFNNVTNGSLDVVYTITPYFGTCAGDDFTITHTVDPEPLFTGNLDATICSDVAIGILLPATDDDAGAITSYDVTAAVDPDLTGAATTALGTNNINLIAADVFTNQENTSRDVVYTIVPYFGTCAGTGFTITATIDPEPLFTGNLDANICSDVVIGVVLPGVDDDAGAITSYDVAATVDPNLTGAASTAVGTTNINLIAADVFNNVTNLPHDVVYTISPYFGACVGDDFMITVTIGPEPVYTGNLDATVCSDDVSGLVLPTLDDDTGAITSYDVAATVDPNLTGAATTATGTTNVNIIAADAFNNVTNASHDVVYTITPYFATCAGADFTITLTVDPEPLFTGNLDVTVCSDNAIGVVLPAVDDDAGAITSYDVTAVVDPDLSGAATIALGTTDVNLITADVFTNQENTSRDVVYTIVPYFGICAGDGFTITATIDPEPLFTGNLDATVCSDDVIGVVLPANDDDAGAITSYDVAAVVDPGLTGAATTATGTTNINLIAADVFNNVTNGALDVVYTITPYFATCFGDDFVITTTINPEPVFTGNLDVTVCSDDATGVILPVLDDDAGVITSYDVAAVVDPGLTGAASTATGTTDINLINGDIFNNVTNGALDVDYTITPYFGACAGTDFIITVTVDPEPLFTGNLDATICSDIAIGIVLPATDDDAGAITSYDVTATVDPDLTGVATTGLGTTNVNFIAGDVFNNVTNASQDVVYTVTPYFGLCAGTSFMITATIDPEPVFTGNLDVTVCSDNIVGVVLPGIDDDAGVITSYDVAAVVDPDLTGAATTAAGTTNVNLIANDVFNNVTNLPQDVVYTITPYFGACAGDDFTITTTINPEPVYTGILDATVCSDDAIGIVLPTNDDDGGAITSYDVAAIVDPSLTGAATTGVGTTNINLISGDVFNNVTNNPLTVVYTISPYFGACVGDDFTITATINPEPVYTGNLDITVCSDAITTVVLPALDDDAGAITSYDVAAVVDPSLTGTASTATGTADVNLITNDVFNNVTNGALDVDYTITPYFGACAGTAFTITVTVDPEPVYTGNLDTTVCSDDVIAVVLPATDDDAGAITSYDVAAIVDPGLTGAATTAAGTTNVNLIASDVFNNVTNGALDVVYTITPYFGACAGTDFTITATISPEPVFTGNLDATVCSDDVIGVILPATDDDAGAITSYDVAAVVDPGLTGAATTGLGTTNVNFIAADVFNNVTNGALDVDYTITPYFGVCAGTAFVITVTINPEPVYTGNLDITVCSDAITTVVLPALDDDAGAITSYDVAAVVDPSLTGTASTATGTADVNLITNDVFNNVTNGALDVDYTITPYFGACAGTAFTITVTVDPEPVYTGNLDTTVCSDDVIAVILPATDDDAGAITSYDVAAIVDPGLTGAATTAAGTTNVNLIASDVFNNVTNGALDVVYTITPYFGACAGTDFTITATISPEPVFTGNLDATVCSDDVIGVILPATDDDAGAITSYDVAAVVDPGLTGAATTGLGTTNVNFIAADVFNNVTNGALDVDYTITPYFGACAGTAFVITVTINPEPVYTGNLDITVCSDAITTVVLPALDDDAGAITSYDVAAVVDPSLTGTASTATGTADVNLITNDVFNNVTNGALDVDYTITPYFGACAGTAFTITVTVDPEPVYTGNLDVLICSDNGTGTGVVLPALDDDAGAITSYDVAAVVDPDLAGAASTAIGTTNVNLIAGDVFTNLENTSRDVVYTITPYFGACAGTDFNITVTVDPEPVGFNDTANPANELCSGDFINYNIQALNIDNVGMGGNALISTFTYTVSSSDEGNVPTPPALDRVAPSTSPITDSFINTSGADVTITYTVIPFGFVTTCQGDPFVIEFVIYSQPLGVADAQTVCSDDPIIYDLNDNITLGGGNGVLSDFTYTVSSDNGLVPPEPNRTIKSPADITFTYTNTSATVANITYTVTPISQANNCQGDPFDVVFTIQVEPAGSNYSETQCGGITLNHDLNTDITNGIDSEFTYTVASNNPGVPAGPNRPIANDLNITDMYNNTTATNATITYTVTPFDKITGCAGDQFTAVFVIEPGPEGAADAEESCSNVPLNYDIQADNIDLIGNGVPGKFTYTVSSTDPANVPPEADRVVASTLPITHNYVNTTAVDVFITYVISPEGFGSGCTGSPFNVVFTIHPEPVLTFNPSTVETICSGDPITTNALTDIASSTFFWQVTNMSGALVTGVNLGDNGTTSTIPHIITNVESADAIITYTFTATSPAPNSCVGQSMDLNVIVNPEPVLDPLTSGTTCSDTETGLTLATNGTSIGASSYRLVNVSIGGGMTPDPGNAAINDVSDASLIFDDKFTNTSNTDQVVTYEVEPTSAEACVGDNLIFFVIIQPEPVLESSLSPLPTCSDVISGIILDTEDTPLSVPAVSYNITSITFDAGLIAGGSNASTGTGLAANVIQMDIYTNTTNGNLFAYYDVVPVSANGCEGDVETIVFTVQPAPALSTTLDETTCSDTAGGIVFDTTPASAAANSYRIVNIIVDAGLTPVVHDPTFPRTTTDVNEITADSFTNPNDDPRTVTWEVVPITAVGCEGPSGIITLTVEPTIDAVTVNNNPNICTGDVTDIDISSTNTPTSGNITFDISVSATGGVTGFIPNLSNLPNPYNIADVLTNNASIPHTVTYTITPQANSADEGLGCTGVPIMIDVVVEPNPVPTATVNAPVICSGDPTDIDLTSTVPGTSFTWTVVDNPNVTGESAGMGTSINQNLSIAAPAFASEVVTYTITPTGPAPLNCVGGTTIANVTVNPPVMIDAGLPQTVCEGEVINVTGNLDSGLPGLYFWMGGSGTFSNPTSLTTSYFPAFGETGNVTFTLTYIDGSGVCAMTSDNVTITINDENEVYAGPGYVICEDETLPLVDATMGGSTTDLQWTVVSGGTGVFSDANILNPTFTPDPGIKNTLITLRLTASDVTTICPDVFSDVFITVNADPIVAISSPDFDLEICESGSIIFNAFGASTYQFYMDGGSGFNPITTVDNTADISGLSAGLYTVRADGTATTGCLGVSNDLTFEVIALPTITVAASATSICENDDVTFTAAGAGVNGLYQFILVRGTDETPVQGPGATDTFNSSLLQDGDIIKVIGTEGVSNSSCTNESNQITISVAPAPVITFTSSTAAANNIICQGDEVTFTATSDIGVEYVFKIDGIEAQRSPSTEFVTSSLVTGSTVSVEVIGPAPTDCSIESDDIMFVVNPLPTAVMSGSTSICEGGLATLQFELTGRLPYSIVYNDGTTDISVTNVASVHFLTVEPTETTTYTLVSVTDANGCSETDLPSEVTITVETAVADFEIESDVEGCSPLEATFRNLDIRNGVTYEWNWGDGSANTISDDELVSHTFNNNSTTTTLTYNITLFARNDNLGCIDTQSTTVDVFPTIITSLVPSTPGGCGPVEISVLNNSLGVVDHRWFYREKGTSQENEESEATFITYELPNETGETIIYEVVYEASNGNCSETEIIEVFVLPELSPSFEISETPVPVIPTSPHVTVTNTTPNSGSWTYLWEWGDGTTSTSVDPGSHTYIDAFGNPTFGTFEIVETITYSDEFGSCEAVFSQIMVIEPVVPIVDFEADVRIGCRPLDVNFTNLSLAVDPETYFWEFINDNGVVEATSTQVNPNFTFFNAGFYTIRLTGSNPIGVTESETKEFYITVNDLPTPSFSLRPSVAYLPDAQVFFQNLSSGADEFFWDFNVLDDTGDEGDLTSMLFEPNVTYLYRGDKDVMLVATNSETLCSDTLIVEKAVFVDEGGVTRVPNAFSPNPDGPSSSMGGQEGFNDTFLPFVDGLSSEPGAFHMLIYDRWGNLVFESWDEDQGWDGYSEDGKLLPMGVYVYKLELRVLRDGGVANTVRIGDVTLIR